MATTSNQSTMRVDIVSAEQSIFSGSVQAFFASGSVGELGIYPNHTPLVTTLKAGQVRVIVDGGDEEVYYISGGLLEVQPYVVTVLSDTAVRANDLDEAAALEAKDTAERKLEERGEEFDYAAASGELARAVAQLRAIQRLRSKLKI